MLIEHYEFGRIRIRGVDYDKDVIILRGEVHSPWWRDAGGHIFRAQGSGVGDRQRPLGGLSRDRQPGSGEEKIREETIEAFVMSGTRVVIDRTGSVIEEFNRLSEGGLDVAAALHLTC